MRIYILLLASIFFSNMAAAQVSTPSTKADKNEIERLGTICKVWGFLKYYHPAIGVSPLNWDSVLIDLLPKARRARSGKDITQVLREMTAIAGPLNTDTIKPASTDSLLKYTQWNWIDKEIQDQQLKKTFKQLLAKGNGGKHNRYATNILPNNRKLGFVRFYEEPFAKMIYPDTSYRLLALFRHWNIINYFFPYYHLMDHSWNKVLYQFIPVFRDAPDQLSYHLGTQSLITYLNDGHGFAASSLLRQHFGSFLAPFDINYVEDKYIVGNALNDALFAETKLAKGDIILEMHGKPIQERISYLAKYFGGSNEFAIKAREIPKKLAAWKDTLTSITVQRGTEIMHFDIKYYSYQKIFIPNTTPPGTIWKSISDDIGYVKIELLQSPDTLKHLFADLAKTKTIILDFRGYPAFQVMYPFLSYVNTSNRPFARFVSPVIERPGYFKANYNDMPFEPLIKEGGYKGKLILLVNEQSGSLGEFFPMALQMLENTVTIGHQTWGGDGNQEGIIMPGNIATGFSALGIYYPDGTICQRAGIKIDIVAQPTIQGIRNGTDELLQRAITFATTGK